MLEIVHSESAIFWGENKVSLVAAITSRIPRDALVHRGMQQLMAVTEAEEILRFYD